ncbi:ribosomal protein L1-like protein [Melampsora americana]|nr:ribosomal protein L1-like protein [Melampsora americana]
MIQPLLKKEVNSNVMRGRIFLPNEIPKDSDVPEEILAVIVKEDSTDAKLAIQLGANHVGDKKLIEQIVEGVINPTKLLCHPDQLPLLVKNSSVAKVLGRKGLIPSEKRGTVSTDIAKLIQDAKGALDWSLESSTDLIKAELGKVGMGLREIEENVMALVDVVGDIAHGGNGVLRPYKSGRPIKRPGVKKVTVTVTGGPQITVH